MFEIATAIIPETVPVHFRKTGIIQNIARGAECIGNGNRQVPSPKTAIQFGHVIAAVVPVYGQSQIELPQVVQAVGAHRPFLRACQHRQKQRTQNSDDRNDHQQFDQGKTPQNASVPCDFALFVFLQIHRTRSRLIHLSGKVAGRELQCQPRTQNNSAKRILEMEYQKSAIHGLSQRPDIVFHIPRELSGDSVHHNNYAVWALKRDATSGEAVEDFDKLDEMCDVLKYPLAIFVNIASSKTRLDLYRGKFSERIHAFAFLDPKGSKIQYSYFDNGKIVNFAIGH